MVDDGEDGSRVVRLYLPFDHAKHKIDRITIKAIKLDHVMRWQAGEFRSAIQFLAHLTGMQEIVLRQLRYPDAERVLAVFFQMLPQDISTQIASGEIPPAPQRDQDWDAPPITAQPPVTPPPATVLLPPEDNGGLDLGER